MEAVAVALRLTPETPTALPRLYDTSCGGIATLIIRGDVAALKAMQFCALPDASLGAVKPGGMLPGGQEVQTAGFPCGTFARFSCTYDSTELTIWPSETVGQLDNCSAPEMAAASAASCAPWWVCATLPRSMASAAHPKTTTRSNAMRTRTAPRSSRYDRWGASQVMRTSSRSRSCCPQRLAVTPR